MSRRLPLLLLLALSSCSTIATHEEYASYRAIRTASEDRDRLVAMQRYAQHYPTGLWSGEVQTMRRSHEEDVWSAGNTTREGLEWYLQVFPDGQHVEEARPRLAALQTVGSRREEEHAHVQQLEQHRQEQQAEARRTWVTRAVTYWVRTLVGIRNYGSPIGGVARANPDFSRAFGQPPPPACTPASCVKHYGQVFHIPVPGATRIDRHIDVYLRLVLDHGRVERAELLLPNKGFSRWYEMENATVVTDEDPEQRQAALNWALDRIQPIIREVATGARVIDFVPEPIDALPQDAQAITEAAPDAPDEPSTPAPTPTPTPSPTPTPTPQDNSLDALLNEAAGNNPPPTPTPTPTPAPTPPPATEELVLPVGLVAVQRDNVRIVVFAAGDEDYGNGYDGIFIERVR